MIGVIHLDVFHAEVGVFASEKKRLKYLRKNGCDPLPCAPGCFGSAHMDVADNGAAWFTMFLREDANGSTWAHECSHLSDFMCDRFGIPINIENTEIRAYLIGCMFSQLEDMMQ